jgi:hypothetical protein
MLAIAQNHSPSVRRLLPLHSELWAEHQRRTIALRSANSGAENRSQNSSWAEGSEGDSSIPLSESSLKPISSVLDILGPSNSTDYECLVLGHYLLRIRQCADTKRATKGPKIQ